MPATLDARTLRDAMSRYLEALDRHREEIDSLNVYPVPDGDTGTNMLLTQRAVAEALRDLDGAPLPEVAEAISRAALMGARGNSGVILSQVLRGMCARLATREDPGALDLAEALAEAAEEARAAVADPVEGTMLTVVRDAAEAAGASLAQGESCAQVARAALDAATASLERTREQLPVLAAAGVVDAGGKGVVLLFDALAAALHGGDLSVAVGPLGPVGARAGREPFRETVGLEYGFEVMYLLEADDAVVPSLKQRLGALGESLVVVGGGGLFNVHVHTNEPGTAVEEGIEAGRPRQVRITSLTDQVEEACLAGQARAVRQEPEVRPAALVAVATGTGFGDLFRSLGAVVVEGGPGRFPSVGDLVAGIGQAVGNVVFVLPNHANVLPAARAAAEQSPRRVEVLETLSMAHGVSVAASFSADTDDDSAMLAAQAAVRSAALARAEREAETDAGPVATGDWVGMAFRSGRRERIEAVGPDAADVALRTVHAVAGDGTFELLSLYVGSEADPAEAARVREALAPALQDVEMEVHDGGQPRYPYLIGLE